MRSMAKKLSAWLKEKDAIEVDPESLNEDIAALMDHHYDDDGYEMAKVLERRGWDPDASLVELLDGSVFFELNEAHSKAVQEWVQRENIVIPEHYVGREVSFKRRYGGLRGDNIEYEEHGEITHIYGKDASVVIRCPHLEHSAGIAAANGIVVLWENVILPPGEPHWPGEISLEQA